MARGLFDLAGRCALVTGAGRGIGKVLALALAEAGAKVALCSRTLAECEAAAEAIRKAGGEALALRCDVTVRADCERLVMDAAGRFGRLDVVLCNAGVSIPRPAEEMDEATWDRTIDTNLKGAFNVAQLAARQMIRQGGGGSIIVTSSNASLVAFRGRVAYGAAKAGVDQMVRTMAFEWGPHGIRVNAFNPGWMEHAMSGVTVTPERRAELVKGTPLARPGRLEELVGPVVFLASDASSFVTGVSLAVDGGWVAV